MVCGCCVTLRCCHGYDILPAIRAWAGIAARRQRPRQLRLAKAGHAAQPGFQGRGRFLAILYTVGTGGGIAHERGAQYGWHLKAARARLNGGRRLVLKADAVGLCSGSRAESGRVHQTGRVAAPAAVRAHKGRGFTAAREYARLLCVPRGQAIARIRYKRLLFHARLGAQGRGYAAQVADFVALVTAKPYNAARARAVSVLWSIGGSALPRRSARRKIPAQALGDK